MKKNTILGAISGSALLFVGAVAFAGLKDANSADYVVVKTASRSAEGVISSARLSPDSSQNIGCWIAVSSATSPATAYCSAADSAGHFLECSSTATAFVQAVGAINSDSWIEFIADANGYCTNMVVDTESYYSPKT